MKCNVLFSQGSVRTVFRWSGHFSYMSKKISSSLQQCKNYKNRSRFSKVMITNVLPPFYGSQCTWEVWRCRTHIGANVFRKKLDTVKQKIDSKYKETPYISFKTPSYVQSFQHIWGVLMFSFCCVVYHCVELYKLLVLCIYTVNHKKGDSTFVIITLENLDGF